MTNAVLFLNSFFSYLLVFAIIVALVIVACTLGVKWKKSSDAKKGISGQPNMPNTIDVEQ
ncbi:MAG: hypothetical protein K2P19_04770 [Kineothrix sp.]|nr:hypothetical protein [Kineothrix sp.]NBI92585.1 hypothetical protein [Lachnospiraceae bacterium]